MITKSSILNLKNNINILDVISSFINIKKSGSSYKALCPFHSEKTPSFNINPKKQLYHCFGCGAGGDSITFIMEYEKLNYKEALEYLSDKYNIPLVYEKNNNHNINNEIFNKHINLLNDFKEFYINNLNNTLNSSQVIYLKKRGLSKESIIKWEIGYVDTQSTTNNYINKKYFNLNKQELIDIGILALNESKNSLYCVFINRILFPIYSNKNILVGFGGRTTSNHNTKYLNTPKTFYFEKSNIFYGYNHAKNSIRKKQQVIIVEGYLDVILLHQVGFTNTIATLGTALTIEHCNFLKKLDVEVLLAFDGDNAGKKAALKSSILLINNNIKTYIITFKEKQDPADLINNNEIKLLNDYVLNRKPALEYIIDDYISLYKTSSLQEQQDIIINTIEFINTLDTLIKSLALNYLQNRIGTNVNINNIQKSIKNIKLKPNNSNSQSTNIQATDKKTKSFNTPIKNDNVNNKLNMINKNSSSDNIAELLIIKTILKNYEFKKLSKVILEAKYFISNKELYKDIINNTVNLNHDYVKNLLNNNTLNELTIRNEFIKQCDVLKIHYYKQLLNNLNNNSNFDFNEKFNKIKKYKIILEQLNKKLHE